jgi:hypothetical protein
MDVLRSPPFVPEIKPFCDTIKPLTLTLPALDIVNISA